jgi:hypothetical protein
MKYNNTQCREEEGGDHNDTQCSEERRRTI